MSMKDKHKNPYIDYVDESTPKVRFEEIELDWDGNIERKMGIVRGVNNRPCQVCGELSKFVDFCAEATVCSQQCQNAMYEGIYKFIKHMETCELE